MRRFLRSVNTWLTTFGLDLRATARSTQGLPAYVRELRTLKRQAASAEPTFQFATLQPHLGEAAAESGQASGHYFHQDLLVARRVRLAEPKLHVDVGSRIDGFVAHVAAFRDIEVFDIRPLSADIPNVRFRRVDLMAQLPEGLVDYCDSLSCLHALEHFGLGRYGDPVRYDGHLIGLSNLRRILKPCGTFYLSVPIGPQRIEFNAHRVFSVEYLLRLFADSFKVDRFSFVDDAGDLHEDVSLAEGDVRRNFGCVYGCGVFEMTKN